MKLNHFEKDIPSTILDRGYDDYMRGLVEEISGNHNVFHILVSGTKKYKVKVELNDQQSIVASGCDCPFAQSFVCKHQVAAFFALRDLIKEEDSTPSLEELLMRLSKEQLVEIIMERVNASDTLYDRLMIKLSSNLEDELTIVKNFIEETVGYHQGKKDFISYYEMSELASDLETVLEKAENISDPLDAADMALLLFEKSIETIELGDESSGELGFLIRQTVEFLQELATTSDMDTQTKEILFHKIVRSTESAVMDVWNENRIDLLKICMIFRDDKNISEQLMSKINQFLAEESDSSYYRDELLTIKLSLLPRKDRLTFLKENRKNSGMRKELIDRLMQQKKYSAVIDYSLEGEKEDQSLRGLQNQWKFKRYAAYKALEMKMEQKMLAEELLIGGEFDYYKELKLLGELDYPALLQKLKGTFTYVKVIVAENDLPALLQYVQKRPREIDFYANKLIKDYPEEVQVLYTSWVKDEAGQARDRKAYQQVCRHINKSRKYIDPQHVDALLTAFKTIYKFRPAFVDELNKIS